MWAPEIFPLEVVESIQVHPGPSVINIVERVGDDGHHDGGVNWIGTVS